MMLRLPPSGVMPGVVAAGVVPGVVAAGVPVAPGPVQATASSIVALSAAMPRLKPELEMCTA
jgi:hypothetical protein